MGWHKGAVPKGFERGTMKSVDEQLAKEMKCMAAEYIRDYVKRVNDFIDETLRNKANPPIKGDVTPGKIRWRGIKLKFKNNEFGRYILITQRGTPIGVFGEKENTEWIESIKKGANYHDL